MPIGSSMNEFQLQSLYFSIFQDIEQNESANWELRLKDMGIKILLTFQLTFLVNTHSFKTYK